MSKIIRMNEDELVSLVNKILKETKNEGLWDNIRAKRERGERPSRKGSEAYNKAVEAGKKIKSMEEGENETNYMFWQNLKTMKHSIDEILSMDKNMVDSILNDGHDWAIDHISTSCDDVEEVYHFINNRDTIVESDIFGFTELLTEGRKDCDNRNLNKPWLTPNGPKKRSVCVKNDSGNVVKVNFGDPNMRIKKSNPERRKSFRARHNCDNPGPKWKARYWSCKFW
jgi:hypothetical protein